MTLEIDIATVPRDELPAVLGRLVELEARVRMRLSEPTEAPAGAAADRNLDVHEAAARLGMSAAWLYRNGAELPCSVRIGRRLLFSERGLEAFLARRKSA
ncbi:MAG: helix-turn-helix domain-containing protein [Vicinamibacteria bacterium]|nr:helix-turn-helix domain-containing protein [Vicinamibacteria bacterium]